MKLLKLLAYGVGISCGLFTIFMVGVNAQNGNLISALFTCCIFIVEVILLLQLRNL